MVKKIHLIDSSQYFAMLKLKLHKSEKKYLLLALNLAWKIIEELFFIVKYFFNIAVLLVYITRIITSYIFISLQYFQLFMR